MSIQSTDGSSRLTLLTRMFWPDGFGGVERRTRCMAEAFTDAGVGVRVVTQRRGPDAETLTEQLDPGYSVTRLAEPRIGWRWRWRELVTARWWARAVRDHAGAGWVWATDPLQAAGAIFAGAGDRLVYNPPWCAAGMHRTWLACPRAWTLRRRWLLRWIERLAYRRAARIVVASDNLAGQFRRAYGDRPGLVRVAHGVDAPAAPPSQAESRAALGIDRDAFVVGLVCRLDPLKDVPFLLEAVHHAGSAVDRLLIVGEGPDRDRLERAAERLGLSDRVIWAGHLPNPTAAYGAMDAMVLTSLYESFGNVVLEAMAAGTPVIGRRRDDDSSSPVLVANDELIDHGRTGFLVASHDAGALARLLVELSGDRDRLRAMRATAHQAAMARPWRGAIDDYLALLGWSTVRPIETEEPAQRAA